MNNRLTVKKSILLTSPSGRTIRAPFSIMVSDRDLDYWKAQFRMKCIMSDEFQIEKIEK